MIALWLAARDHRVPWYAKVLSAAVAAYVLSPIDLIPDFIPILGYVDDLLIVSFGISPNQMATLHKDRHFFR